MKVVCLNTGGYHLTINKIYDVSPMIDDSIIHLFDYMIENDNGYKHCVEGSLFVTLDDMRNTKLESIGI